MTNVQEALRVATGGIAAIVTFLWGGADYWLIALCLFVVMDYITGVIAAVILKTVSSTVGFVGILKKLLILIIVAVAHVLDTAMGIGGTLRSIVIGVLLANEGISILENCARCGLPVPPKLLEVLEQLRSDEK